jgi:hypothetical protein
LVEVNRRSLTFRQLLLTSPQLLLSLVQLLVADTALIFEVHVCALFLRSQGALPALRVREELLAFLLTRANGSLSLSEISRPALTRHLALDHFSVSFDESRLAPFELACHMVKRRLALAELSALLLLTLAATPR